MSHGTDYIFNATRKGLEGNQTHLMCYLYLKTVVKEKIPKKIWKNRAEILNCIDDLHSMMNESIFPINNLFKSQFSFYSEFLNYFEKEWASSDSKTTNGYFDFELNILMTIYEKKIKENCLWGSKLQIWC